MEKLLYFTGNDLQELSLEEWLEVKPEPLQPIAARWFEEIKQCGPDVQGIFHDNYPIGCVNSAPFAYVNAYSKHVNLGFFYGADLPDEKGLLEGSGKRMRHIKLRPGEAHHDEAMLALLEAAYLDIKMRLSEQKPG